MVRVSSPAPRIAVAAIGDPDDPALWSGTPNNIVSAFRGAGVDVVTIDVRYGYDRVILDTVALPRVVAGMRTRGLRPGLDRERRVAQQSMMLSRARAHTARKRLESCGRVDGVVQMGTGYIISHASVVSYEDMTVAQAINWPETRWGDVPARMVRRRREQQEAAYQRNRGAAFSTGWAAESATTQLHCAPEKAHVVGIGANFVIDQVDERDWSTPRFFFAGREWSRKNGADVVTAFAEVRRSFPQAELHLAGHHPRIDQPGVVDHGHLDLGVAHDRRRMIELWATSTCCVVPSRFEPAGIIYVEAMHAGIPSIGTTQGGAADIIGDAGTVVDPGNMDSLVAAMRSYCNPGVAAKAGLRARRRSTRFSWANVASGLLAALGLEDGSRSPISGEAGAHGR